MLCQFLLYSKVIQFSSVQFSRTVVSDSLRPHGLQHTRSPCPSPTPGVCVAMQFIKVFLFVCFNFMKNTIGNLTGIALNLSVALGSKVIFTILVLPIQEHGIFFHLFMSSVIYFISIL